MRLSKGRVIYYQVGDRVRFHSSQQIFSTPLPGQVFSTPPPQQDDKSIYDPQSHPLTHLPPCNLHTHTILLNACPSDLNETCMKHKGHLSTFCRLIIHADQINDLCLYFLHFISDVECSLKLLILRMRVGAQPPEATAVVLMKRHLEIRCHKCMLQIYLRTKSSVQHDFIDHCILLSTDGFQREIR